MRNPGSLLRAASWLRLLLRLLLRRLHGWIAYALPQAYKAALWMRGIHAQLQHIRVRQQHGPQAALLERLRQGAACPVSQLSQEALSALPSVQESDHARHIRRLVRGVVLARGRRRSCGLRGGSGQLGRRAQPRLRSRLRRTPVELTGVGVPYEERAAAGALGLRERGASG